MDVLLGSAHPDIRAALVDYFNDLCLNVGLDTPSFIDTPTETPATKPSSVEAPHRFFLRLLLSNKSSLWMTSASGGGDIEVWGRCEQYFDFLYQLASNLTSELSSDHTLTLSLTHVLCASSYVMQMACLKSLV